MKKIFYISCLIFSFSNAQLIKPKEFEKCVLENCDLDKLLIDRKFKMQYGGPRKIGGSLCLYKNKSNKEYVFVYRNEDEKIEQFIYYLPFKAEYEKFINEKIIGVNINAMGRVFYDDEKKYYQVSISSKK
ncbi:hypothetical protein JSO56_00815 [Riemerella anatipestifer]|uniref:hypothetical protein n=1 Tax=Riemerella anatipestifer TaxID=34085 RepID=UPI0030C1C76B